MTQETFSKKGKNILRTLAKKKYKSTVPDEDLRDFLILQEKGFVTSITTSDQGVLHYVAPQITNKGLAYLAEYPKLNGPHKQFDWKWIITTIIALASVIIAYLSLNK